MTKNTRLWPSVFPLLLCSACSGGDDVVSGEVSCASLVVFDSERGGASDLFAMDLESRIQVKIDFDGSSGTKDWLPDLSPGGAEIVFVSADSAGAGQLYIANSDGSNPRQLTSETGRYESPAWSPDGSWIAFEHGSEEGWGLYLIRPNGSDLRRVGPPNANLFHPSWAPDGSRLAVVTGDEGGWVVGVINLASGELEQVTKPGLDVGFVNWSPDGNTIALDAVEGSNFDLYLLDLETGRLDRLTEGPAVDARPTWSPDGTRLVFHSTRGSGGSVGGEDSRAEFDLYLLDISTGQTVRLTDNAYFDGHPDWCRLARGSGP